ncbi:MULTISPECIES: DUF1737 domain-containing protein [Streptomyces]|jgi:hypothetical protein|uniref:DUF1737 domain-containing protein n=1 Tax=Streptomyces thermogriseus TaxID=75292 RepID=A0ABN1STP9_9ACTN|nr:MULTISPECIES: DUF1737 domain-containing protein [Streptomyces]MDN5381026.1 DUF1737 domain-containing protein [Streptomyces sp. LB8]
MTTPPDGLPVYRVPTGPDDAAFCHRASEAPAMGHRLHEGPSITFGKERVIVAQAVVRSGHPRTGNRARPRAPAVRSGAAAGRGRRPEDGRRPRYMPHPRSGPCAIVRTGADETGREDLP